MLEWLGNNWDKICLIVVGALALIVYWLQERRKKIEAASLIILQIDEIQNGITELSTYIVDKILNETAFYESLPLFKEDYWNMYKHYFVKEMDASSYNKLNQFYKYVTEIQEQQNFIKSLLNNHFFLNQNCFADIETYFFIDYMAKTNNTCFDLNQFWNLYNTQKLNATEFINKNGYNVYIPTQTRTTIDKILKKYFSITVIGTDGYNLLKKYSQKRW